MKIQLVIYGIVCAYSIIISAYIVKTFLNDSLPDYGNANIVLSRTKACTIFEYSFSLKGEV